MKIRPTNDVAFHFVFGRERNSEILLGFIKAVLQPTNPEIASIAFKEVEITPRTLEQKTIRLDLHVWTSDRQQIDIEVQVGNLYNMEKRSLYYWSHMFSDQLSKGEVYSQLKRTIAINVLDSCYLPDRQVHSVFRLREEQTHSLLTDLLEIHFLEYRNLPHASDTDDPLTRWLLFFKGLDDIRLREELCVKDDQIKAAYEELDKLAADKSKRELYEIRERAIRDEISRISDAEEVGWARGREEGRKEGREEGIEQNKTESAKSMLAKKYPLIDIQFITGLDEQRLEEIRKTMEDVD